MPVAIAAELADGMMNSLRQLEHVFVYGTLKRGQCRQACWPVAPACISQGWIKGMMLDLGPYPALLEGNDRVWGELWSFEAHLIEAVHCTLDQIEVYNQPGLTDEYQRVRVAVQLHLEGDHLEKIPPEKTNPAEEPVWASTYRFVGLQSAQQARSMPPSLTIDGASYVVWPACT